MSDNTQRQQLVFIIRIWVETGQSIVEQWRGSIEQVPSGERRFFNSLENLSAFILSRLCDGRSITPPEK